MTSKHKDITTRRGFLRSAAGASLLGLAGVTSSPVLAVPKPWPAEEWQVIEEGEAGVDVVEQAVALPKERRLNLINDHTGERLDIAYVTHGMYIDESLQAVAHLMRDHRANKERVMDIGLLDILYQVQAKLDVDEPLHILSGYRTPETNAALRKRSNGVARHSLHMDGKAADIHLPGVKTSDLRAVALELQAGGVGYYGGSGFVHVDTGRLRSWRG